MVSERAARWWTRLGTNVDAIAVLALACGYVIVMSGHLHSIDGLLAYRQGRSILFEHSLHFGTPVWWGTSMTTSKYGIGLSLAYLPGLALFAWLLPNVPVQSGPHYDFGLLYADPLYAVAGAPVHLLATVLTAYLVARFVREVGFGTGPALWATAFFGVGSPALVYARGDWSEPLTALCWVAALYAALRYRRTASRRALLLCGAALFYGILARPVEGAIVVPFAFLLAQPGMVLRRWTAANWRALGVVLGSGTVGVLVTLLVDWDRFGSPFTTGYAGESWTTPLNVGLPGALISPGRGILWEFPALVLAPLGFWALWQSGKKSVALALAGLSVVQLLNVAAWDVWWGGANWGLRLFVPALPLLAILTGTATAALPRPLRGWLPGLLLLGGVAWAIPCLVTDLFGGYTILADGSSGNFRLHAYPLIGAWEYLRHWRALSLTDSSAADILWLRIARPTHNLSLLAPVVAGLGGIALFWKLVALHLPLRRPARLA